MNSSYNKRFKILVTAGGTAIAWHICNIVKQYLSDKIEIYICDTNDPNLVPSSTIAKKTFQVSLCTDNSYKDEIKNIIESKKIDAIVPLIPVETDMFAADSELILTEKIKTSLPTKRVIHDLVDKTNLNKSLTSIGVKTPRIYERKSDIDWKRKYLVKPRLGFGSRGIEVVTGEELVTLFDQYQNFTIEEYLHDDNYQEVTVEVYNGKKGIYCYSRERIETKAGVCTKMRPVDKTPFIEPINLLVKNFSMPIAFNVQFLLYKKEWYLFDVNLRLGAGTALASAAGFQLTRAFLCELADLDFDENILIPDHDVKYVLRAYKEIVI